MRYVNPDILDLALAGIALADEIVVLSGAPASWYAATDPPEWAGEEVVTLGTARRPSGRNGFVYEATAWGTTGTSEPSWPELAGLTVEDGTVTWTARENVCLASAALTETDFALADGAIDGRKISTAQKSERTVLRDGTASHTALLRSDTRELVLVTECLEQVLTSGNLINILPITDTIRSATAEG